MTTDEKSQQMMDTMLNDKQPYGDIKFWVEAGLRYAEYQKQVYRILFDYPPTENHVSCLLVKVRRGHDHNT